MVNKLKFVLVVCITFLSSGINNREIRNLTDSNFDSEVQNGNNNPWYIMFYLETCPHCKTAKDQFQILVKEKEFASDSDDNKVLRVGKVECGQNVWTCLRFNITKVPTIYLLVQQSMFEFTTYPSKDALYKFYKEEKLVGSQLRIPTALGYTSLIMKVFGEAVIFINEYMNGLIKSQGYDFEWTSTNTIILLLLALVLMILMEYIVISICCSPKKTKRVENKKSESESVAESVAKTEAEIEAEIDGKKNSESEAEPGSEPKTDKKND